MKRIVFLGLRARIRMLFGYSRSCQWKFLWRRRFHRHGRTTIFSGQWVRSAVGVRLRWFLTHGGAIVYNCLRLSSCADEGRADLLAILPSALYPHLTAVFHIYDTIQHFTLAVGADRCRDIIERYIEEYSWTFLHRLDICGSCTLISLYLFIP